jgi:hypothetical protein
MLSPARVRQVPVTESFITLPPYSESNHAEECAPAYLQDLPQADEMVADTNRGP